MRSALKLTAAAVLAIGSLGVGTAASAAECPLPTTVAAFAGLGTCDSGDKTYTWLANSENLNSDNIGLEVFFDNLAEELHTFSVNPIVALSAGTYTLSYTIEVNVPNKWLDRVSIAQDVPQETPGVTFTKIVDLDDQLNGGLDQFTLTVLNSSQALVDLPGEPTKLWIYETVVVTGEGRVNSFTDTYTQNVTRIPEPGSLALLGVGLAAFGLARRRKG